MSLCQFCGFVYIFLTSFFYGRVRGGILYDNNPNYHALFMTYGLVFFNGEALLAYRFLRNDPKALSKLIHGTCHLLAIGMWSAALAQIVHFKNVNKYQHVYSFHSWFGIAIMAAYIIQFLFGLFNYGLPGVPLEIRAALMPYHRAVGMILFICSVAQALIGNISYSPMNPETCSHYLDCPSHMELIFNFSLVSLILYAILVVVLVSKKSWAREHTPDEIKTE
ncbi:unnamed protein product, partial [Mesorhabditis spiculigera]